MPAGLKQNDLQFIIKCLIYRVRMPIPSANPYSNANHNPNLISTPTLTITKTLTLPELCSQ